MPTTPLGVWYPGPNDTFPPGFSGAEGGTGWFEQLAESVDSAIEDYVESLGPFWSAHTSAATFTANTSLTRWGTAITITPPGGPVRISADVVADADNSVNLAYRALTQVRISLDGGSTWNAGLVFRQGVRRVADDSGATRFTTLTAAHDALGTPTGSVVVEVRVGVEEYPGSGSARFQRHHLRAKLSPGPST